jgi:hypothetical protein
MDIIYLIILTPITIAVMYGWHCIKMHNKRFEQLPEATPYQFEKDEPIDNFDEFTEVLTNFKMYRGKAK